MYEKLKKFVLVKTLNLQFGLSEHSFGNVILE